MRVSRTEEYGVRMVMSLASDGGQLTIRELAARDGLPEPTVAKVVARLRRAGLVEAARGRKGGYTLVRPAASVSLASVVEAVGGRAEGNALCSRMTSADGACVHALRCRLRPVWRDLETVIGSFLAGITVADVVGARALDPVGSFTPRPAATAGG